MRLGVLFSGGKDSCYALYKASKEHEMVCLLSVVSKNPDSYMFHTPNADLTILQARAIGLPIIIKETEGKKEEELTDLKELIKEAKKKYSLQGIVTGAVASVYQASRIQNICNELDLWCFNPLWQKNQLELIEEIIKNKFEVIISKVAAYPLDESFLGKKIDNKIIKKLKDFQQKYRLNIAGEGGEFETFVTNAPIFKKKIEIIKAKREYSNNAGVFIIEKAELK